MDNPAKIGRHSVTLADCGSYWSKMLVPADDRLLIMETRELIRWNGLRFDLATGHTAGPRALRTENELVALAVGAWSMVGRRNMLVVDVGSRDTKLLEFRDGQVCRMDWNAACGSSTGATVEMLGRHYTIHFGELQPSDRWIPVTCGVFAMERIIDLIGSGSDPSEAVAMFVHGVARNVYSFSGKPDRIYLSGGFCENPCFVRSLARYSEVVPLGRTVPLEGLRLLRLDPGAANHLRKVSSDISSKERP